MNKKFVLVLVTDFIFVLTAQAADCPTGQVWGTVTNECVPASGRCGTGCTYTLDETGMLTYNVTGGDIAGPGQGVRYDKKLNDNVKDITYNVGDNKLTHINGSAFAGRPNLRSDWTLPNDIFAEGAWLEMNGTDFKNAGFSTFVMPEALSYAQASGKRISSVDGFTVYCTGAQIQSGGCQANATRYEHEGDLFVVYNSDNSVFGVYENYGGIATDTVVESYQTQDPETGRTTNYDGRGQVVDSFTQNQDGSTSYFDKDGKITSTKNSDGSTTLYDKNGNISGYRGKRIYTVEEAAKVAKERNRFTLRYK